MRRHPASPRPAHLALPTLFVLPALLLAGCALTGPDLEDAPPAPSEDRRVVRLEPFADGFDQPILLVDDPATDRETYVAEQGGLVWRLVDGARDPAPFLDVSALTRARGEQGLLGLAFGVGVDEGRDAQAVYVSYTDLDGDSVLARYLARDGKVDHENPEVLLKVDQPYSNHNGGHVVFGPDGMLYYGLGDGGSANDPHGNGQDPRALLGSLLRIDVSLPTAYAIPPDNPYADGAEGAREVYAKGLRNPWRFSFDKITGDLWIADVGQNRIEEVNLVHNGAGRGANFGWNVYEGTARRPGASGDTFSPHVPPVAQYDHDEGCSVTGGFLYRGPSNPGLTGAYVFSDYCSGTLWALRSDGNDGWRRDTLLDTDLSVTSFGEDDAGELYVVDHGGAILRIASASGPVTGVP